MLFPQSLFNAFTNPVILTETAPENHTHLLIIMCFAHTNIGNHRSNHLLNDNYEWLSDKESKDETIYEQ